MSKLKRLFLLFLPLLLVITTTTSTLLSVTSPASVGADAVTLADPEVPVDGNEEVAWWVDRTSLVLFNNTLPNDTSSATEVEELRNNENTAIMPSQDVKYRGAGGCTLTVKFSSANAAPSSGTLTGSGCKNRDKTVRLESKSRGIVDGYRDVDGKTVTLTRYLRKLTGCPGGASGATSVAVTSDKDSYDKSVVFDLSKKNGRFSGWWDTKSGQDLGSKASAHALKVADGEGNLSTVTQIAYCPDGVGFGDSSYGYRLAYGDRANINNPSSTAQPTAGNGRTLNVKKGTTREKELAEVKEAATSYSQQKAKQKEFIEFFSNSDNMNVLRGCADAKLTTSYSGRDAELRQYAVDTLIRPIPGPFSDCIRAFFEGNEAFDAIDSIPPPEMVGAPDAVGSGEGECSGGPVIIGDLICWIGEAIFDGVNAMFTGVIEYFAEPPNIIADSGSKIQATWANLRNIANVLFVIAFLLVIFQYVTNVSVAEAYFVKKFIPRLVIAVILTQASGWIASEMAFFVHDLGSSIQSIVFWSGGGGFTAGSGAVSVLSGGAMIALFLSGGGFALMVAALFMGIVLLIVLLVSVIVLAIRHILIIVLAMFAPLAFACLAIPQLDGVFKKWLKMYFQLLMMYPIIMLMIAAASLLSSTLSGGGMLEQLIGLTVQFLPYFVLPFTFKFSGGLMGNVGAKINGLGKKGMKMGVNQGKKQYAKTDFAQDRASKKSYKDGLRSEKSGRRITSQIAGGTGRFGRKYAGTDEQEIAKAKMAEEQIRVASAQERAKKAERSGELLKAQQRHKAVQESLIGQDYIDATGATKTHTADTARTAANDVLAGEASSLDTSFEKRAAIIQELGRQKADGHIARISNNLGGQGIEGAKAWNELVGDNEAFSAMTSLNKGFGTAINPGDSKEQIAQGRLKTFAKKGLASKAGDSKDAWKDSVLTALSSGDTAALDKVMADHAAIMGSEARVNLNVTKDELDELVTGYRSGTLTDDDVPYK